MLSPKASQIRFATLTLAMSLVLAACGGGGGGSSGTSADTTASTSNGPTMAADAIVPNMVQAQAAVTPDQYETVAVTSINSGAGITTSPILTKSNGSVVQTLTDLPEGIANSAWMKKTTGRLPLHVVLANGTYCLSSSWAWTPSQSGRADSPITIEAQTPGGVIISGAKVVTVTKAVHGGAAKVVTDLSTSGLSNFEQLWVNGGRAIRARTPNLGSFYYVKKAVSTWAGSATYGGDPVNEQAFGADPASLAYLNGLTAAQKSAAVLVAAQSWTTSHHHVQEWNANNEVRVSPSANWPFLFTQFGFAQRYFIENIPSALDAPAEWYFDPTSLKLSYIPNDAQKLGDLVFSVPRVNQLLTLTGQVSSGKWVEYLNFKGLKFRYAHAPLPAAGLVDQQAAVAVEAAIQMDGVRNASISNCEISRVGGYGVWMRTNVRNVSITGCELFDTGAGGIKVGLVSQSTDANATGYNTIDGNRIHAVGFQFPGAVGVWIGQSAYNTVSNNLIGDTTYSGISVGWTWGYGASPSHHNLITKNFLYNIIQGSLSDGGGIYTLGISPGTALKGNVIKNVHGFGQYGVGAWGMYSDLGSSNILWDSNIVVGTDNGGYLLGNGLGNTVSNNVMAQGDHSEIQVSGIEVSKQVTFDHNYILPTQAAFINYGNMQPTTSYVGNVVSTQYVPTITAPTECGGGCSVSSDPQVSAGGTLDVPTLTNSSGSVISLPSGTASNWPANSVTSYASPATWWAVPAGSVPRRGFDFDATTMAIGATPDGMKVVPLAHPELVSVIRNGSGEKCLGFQDSAGMTNAWEPYSFVETNYDSGTSTVTFTLKVDSTTEFIHEWRDYKYAPYKAGPRVVFSGTRGVMVAYRKVANLPVGQWVTVTVTSRQGSNASWDLQIKYQDNTSVNLTGYAPTDAGWSGTKQVLFISNAATTSTPCMGVLSIGNAI